MNSGGTERQTSQICAMFPDASLMPTMLAIVASRVTVDGSMLQLSPARHVVKNDRQRGAFCERPIVLVEAFLRRLVVIRVTDRRPSAPMAFISAAA